MDANPATRPLTVSHSWRWALIGTLVAIGSTTVMDAVGLSNFNTLPVIALLFLFWYLQRPSRAEIGLAWGRPRDYAVAVLYPALALALIGLVAWLSGAVTLTATDWAKTLINLVAEILATIVLALITEEGFFRGWLWASLSRAGVAPLGVMVWTSVAFGLWHLSTALLPTEFRPPLAQVPIYIGNAAVIGFIWAMLRRRSGSIVVTSVSHSVWNTLVYTLFGVGPTLGLLGIHNTAVFGPEVGLVGVALNVVFAAVLWLTYGRHKATPSGTH